MRTLFGRMFLTFWLTLVLGGVLMVVLAPRFPHGRPGGEAAALWRSELLPLHAAEVQQTFGRDGATGVDAYLTEVESRAGVRMFVVPAQPEWTHRRPPRSVRHFARRHGDGRERPFAAHFGPLYVSTPIQLGEATNLRLVAEIRAPGMRGGLPPVHRGPEVLLVALLLASGAMCFLLARSLTRPIRAVQRASRELAEGNLDVRVGDAVAGRRDELAGLARDFDHMAERIQSMRNTEQRLLRDVSHELRSPLARLQVALELARTRAGASAGESLDRIEREAGRLNDIIAQLLTMVRLAAEGDAAKAEVIELSDVLRDVVADAAFEGQARGVRVEYAEDAACRIYGDDHLIRSAMENVIRNAVFYSAENTAVDVEVAIEGADAVVRVRDRGPGVPEDALPQLFDPFFRVAEARERDSGGAGLGLAIAAHAVRAHGGRIEVENVSDGGLRVTIRLPTAPDA